MVNGFGESRADASSQALLVAQESAELLDTGRTLAQVIGAVDVGESARLMNAHTTARLSSEAPDWTFTPGDCRLEETTTGRVDARWEAGQRISVGSDSLAMAIEGARRRSCNGEWAATFFQMYQALAGTGPAIRREMYRDGVSEINAAFVACIASDNYVIEASGHPQVGASGAEFCDVATAADEETLFVGRAQGSSRAHALEKASLMAVRSTLLATLADFGDAIGEEEVLTRAVLLAQALERAIYAIGAQALAGNAHALCSPIEGPLLSDWRPTNSVCGEGFAGVPWSPGVCDEVVTTRQAHDVAAAAGTDAFGEVLGCLRQCITDAAVSGTGESVDTRRAHCDSEEDIWTIVERSVTEQRLSGLLHCADTELFGRLVAAYQEEPARFWNTWSSPRAVFQVTVRRGEYSLSQR